MAVVYAEYYARLFSVLFEIFIPFIYDRLDVYQIEIIKYRSELGYQLLANNTTAITVAETELPANLGIIAFTLAAHSIQHVLFLNFLLLVSIFIYRLNYLKMFMLALLAIIFLEVIDIPMVLTGSIEELLLFQFDPQHYETSLRIMWMNFLNNGGRLGLAMMTAWMIIISCRLPDKHLI